MALEVDIPPVIKTMDFIAAMISNVVASFKDGKMGYELS
jgi:hypothetical protein